MANTNNNTSNPEFTVLAYEGPYVGMEIVDRGTREDAWRACLRLGAGRTSWPAGSYVEVYRGKELVWSKGSIEAVDHSQWLGRCPR